MASLECLTGREVEVLRLVAEGLTNLQIAESLVLSVRTVESHVAAICGKIEVHNRTAAARWYLAQESGSSTDV